jgi:hypothetical protein
MHLTCEPMMNHNGGIMNRTNFSQQQIIVLLFDCPSGVEPKCCSYI